MQYYLDTNILYFALHLDNDSISREVLDILDDPSNTLRTSTVCVSELIYVIQTKLANTKKKQVNANKVIDKLGQLNISIAPIRTNHLQTFADLPFFENHKDPNDRLIVAQAISDKIPLISSDLKFPLYVSSGLQFIQNKR